MEDCSQQVVAWLENAELIFLIFHTFVCIFSREPRLDVRVANQILQTLLEHCLGYPTALVL